MPERSPEITPRCPVCDADAMIPDAFLYDRGDMGEHGLDIGVYTKPKARVLKGPIRTAVRVSVCGDCGHIEWRASDPRKLWEAYVERLAREMGD